MSLGLPARLFDGGSNLGKRFGCPRNQDDDAAVAGKPLGDCPADSSARASDNGYFPLDGILQSGTRRSRGQRAQIQKTARQLAGRGL